MRTTLESIVGNKNIEIDRESLKDYSWDQSFVEPRMPEWVVFPQNVEQIQDLVRVANQENTPLIPFSSGLNLHGATIPDQGGIIMDMKDMNRVLDVDERNRFVVIEPGVSYRRLQDDLSQLGLRIMAPWGVPPSRSVLSSQMERDPSLSSASFEYGVDRIVDIELILPEGELYRPGGWGGSDKPKGSMALPHRFWTGAQGTLGVVTKMALKVEYLPRDGRFFFLCFDAFEEALAPLKMIQMKEIGLECLFLNDFNLAAAIVKDWEVPDTFPARAKKSEDFDEIRGNLPEWTVIVSLPPAPYFPEEKYAYEEKALRKIGADFHVEVLTDVPGLNDGGPFFAHEVLRPWSVLKKFNYAGSVHDLSFKSPLKRIPAFIDIIESVARKFKYPLEDIGGYVVPMERGRAGHCEFEFHCGWENGEEKNRVEKLWHEASRALIDAGAFFDRPYGPWAEMVYGRAGTYTSKLKQLKKELDPNNIMNPGKLCFA